MGTLLHIYCNSVIGGNLHSNFLYMWHHIPPCPQSKCIPLNWNLWPLALITGVSQPLLIKSESSILEIWTQQNIALDFFIGFYPGISYNPNYGRKKKWDYWGAMCILIIKGY